MATTNLTVTSEWTDVCDDTKDFLLTLPVPGAEIEIATTDTGDDPTVDVGHRLVYVRDSGRDSINRALIGTGHVFARTISPASVVAVLNDWTP